MTYPKIADFVNTGTYWNQSYAIYRNINMHVDVSVNQKQTKYVHTFRNPINKDSLFDELLGMHCRLRILGANKTLQDGPHL